MLLLDTATNKLFPNVTETQLLSAALVLKFHVIQSGLVITRVLEPLFRTATNKLFPYATEIQLPSKPVALRVQFIPFGLVITLVPGPIATNKPTLLGVPYATVRQSLFAALVLAVKFTD